MNNKNILLQTSLTHKVAPSNNVWIKLDAKLERNRSLKKVSQYRSLAIAAIMVLVVGTISLFILQKNQYNEIKDTSQSYSVQLFNTENNANEGLYDLNKLRHLKLAYNRHLDKRKI